MLKFVLATVDMNIKLKPLSLPNQLATSVSNWDSNFKQQNPFDLKTDVEIGLRLNPDVDFQFKLTNFRLKSMKKSTGFRKSL